MKKQYRDTSLPLWYLEKLEKQATLEDLHLAFKNYNRRHHMKSKIMRIYYTVIVAFLILLAIIALHR